MEQMEQMEQMDDLIFSARIDYKDLNLQGKMGRILSKIGYQNIAIASGSIVAFGIITTFVMPDFAIAGGPLDPGYYIKKNEAKKIQEDKAYEARMTKDHKEARATYIKEHSKPMAKVVKLKPEIKVTKTKPVPKSTKTIGNKYSEACGAWVGNTWKRFKSADKVMGNETINVEVMNTLLTFQDGRQKACGNYIPYNIVTANLKLAAKYSEIQINNAQHLKDREDTYQKYAGSFDNESL